MALKAAHVITVDHGGRIENSNDDINEEGCMGKKAKWCDYSGFVWSHGDTLAVGKDWNGIAILDSPKNFWHPPGWFTRNYGFIGGQFAYIDDDYTLKVGEELRLAFRVYVHSGDAKEGKVAEKFNDYANPPDVKLGQPSLKG